MMLLMGSEMDIIDPRVTKLLHKSAIPKGELGQWTSSAGSKRDD